MEIRRAAPADLPQIVAMLADDRLGRQRENPALPLAQSYIAAFETIDADPNHLLAVLAEGATILGSLQLIFIPGLSYQGSLRGEIEAVRIAADQRGHGLGTRLVEWAIAECRRRGCKLVQLSSHADRRDAHRFYERLGFAGSHRGFKLSLA